jgi:hypothetical protein
VLPRDQHNAVRRRRLANELLDLILTAGVVNLGGQKGAQRLDGLAWSLAVVVGRRVGKSSKKMLWPCERRPRRSITRRGKELDERAGPLQPRTVSDFLSSLPFSSTPRGP